MSSVSNSMPRTETDVAGPSFFSGSVGTPSSTHTCSVVAIAIEHCEEAGQPKTMKLST